MLFLLLFHTNLVYEKLACHDAIEHSEPLSQFRIDSSQTCTLFNLVIGQVAKNGQSDG